MENNMSNCKLKFTNGSEMKEHKDIILYFCGVGIVVILIGIINLFKG